MLINIIEEKVILVLKNSNKKMCYKNFKKSALKNSQNLC